jgi:putative ABC transport system permease protein
MFPVHLRVAIRFLLREKGYSLINLIGLSIGIASLVLIFTYAENELTFNRHNLNYERIYKVFTRWHEQNSDPEYFDNVTTLFVDNVNGSIPGIKNAVRFDLESALVRVGDELYDENITCTEQSFFNIFAVDVITGKPSEQFSNINSIVLTEKYAKKFFGEQNPVGRLIEVKFSDEEFNQFEIVSVIANLPENSSLSVGIILPYEYIFKQYHGESGKDKWGWQWSNSFVLLEEGADIEEVNSAIESSFSEKGISDIYAPHVKFSFPMLPLKDLHLGLDNPLGLPTDTNSTGFFVLIISGIVIFVIACINYTTLSVGRLYKRSIEVGVRKALGATRIQLTKQFWMETSLVVFIAILLGLVLAELALPLFNNLSEQVLSIDFDIKMNLFLTAIWSLIVLVAGGYPAVVMSGFSPAKAFKGEVRSSNKGRLRKTLVLIQLILSVCLISSMMIMKSQLNYLQSKDLGFSSEQVVALEVKTDGETGRQILERLRNEFSSNPDILSISGSSCAIGRALNEIGWINRENSDIPFVYQNTIDYNYLKTMNIDVVEGRDYDKENLSDWNNGIIVNEAYVEHMGWAKPVGQIIPELYGSREVIGVVENFHFHDLRSGVKPLVMFWNGDFFKKNGHRIDIYEVDWGIHYIQVRIQPEKVHQVMTSMKSYWEKDVHEAPYSYHFVDAEVEKQYREDRRIGTVVSVAFVMAMVIATLGLLGLATMQISQRTKEIGIRKVLGASANSIVSLLSKEIFYLIMVANLIAWPISYYITSKWLQGFAYKVGFNYLVFPVAGITTMVIALIAVGTLSLKVALDNPTKSLKQE